MNISLNWLKKYIPEIEKHFPEEIAKKVSWSLAEVEKIEKKGEGLSNIVVGEIVEVKEHASNPKLAIAKVKVSDAKELTIVFAGSNKEYVKPGTLYPVCLDGGSVYDGKGNVKKIQTTEVGDVVSEGMLCSLSELGLDAEKKGLTLIEDNLPVGTNLIPMLKDHIFEIENKSLTHRPDCFSHRGIAREIAAMFELDFVQNEQSDLITQEKKKIKVSILADDVCSRFTGVTMKDVDVMASPTWLKVHLLNLGYKPINNIVDVSNYIMLDIGQPMHIYDLDKLGSFEITVRKAKKGEKMDAINHKSYELKPNHLVIASPNGVEGIAGIMGGVKSEVDEKTKNILIEAASFDMFSIRKTGMELGLQTDASIRFSRGLTNTITTEAVLAAVKILEDVATAEVSSDITDSVGKVEEVKTLEFNLNTIKRLGGLNIEKTKIIDILSSLNIEVIGAANLPGDLSSVPNAEVELKIPLYRKDLNIPQDIVEEVVRIYGYDRINPELPEKVINATPQNPDYEFAYLAKQQMVASDFDEVYSYSFVGSNTYKQCNLNTDSLIKVINAIAPELEFFRDNILPGLVEKIGLNAPNYDNFGLFELGRIIKKTNNKEEPPLHQKKIAVVQYNKNADSNDIIKAKLEKFFKSIKLNYSFKNLYNTDKSKLSKEDNNNFNVFHVNQTACIFDKDNNLIGYFGGLNPTVKNNFGYEANISIAYLDYELLKQNYYGTKPEYKALNYFPKVSRDVNYKLNDNNADIGEVITELNKLAPAELSLWETKFVDLYVNPDSQEKYITLRYTMQKSSGTLSESEIENLVNVGTELVKTKYDLSLRN